MVDIEHWNSLHACTGERFSPMLRSARRQPRHMDFTGFGVDDDPCAT
jgi:hypothetical protein